MSGVREPRATRLGQFFGPAADQHPGLSGFSLLDHGREAFIVRLALCDLAERSLDMQYYVWDGDTTGRIIVDRVMKAADRGVKVRLLIDDPYYKANDPVIAALDAHSNVEIRLFNPFTNRRWSRLDFILDFRRVNRRMHNKLMVTDNAAAIVSRHSNSPKKGSRTRSNALSMPAWCFSAERHRRLRTCSSTPWSRIPPTVPCCAGRDGNCMLGSPKRSQPITRS